MGTDIALEPSSAAVVKIWSILVDVTDPTLLVYTLVGWVITWVMLQALVTVRSFLSRGQLDNQSMFRSPSKFISLLASETLSDTHIRHGVEIVFHFLSLLSPAVYWSLHSLSLVYVSYFLQASWSWLHWFRSFSWQFSLPSSCWRLTWTSIWGMCLVSLVTGVFQCCNCAYQSIAWACMEFQRVIT